MEYLCHKWPRICSVCRIYNRSFPHSWIITGLVIRSIRRVSHVGQELLTLPDHLCSPPVFCEVRITQSLVFCVVFCRSLFVFCHFSFGHCIVCLLWFTAPDYHFGIFKLFLQLPIFSKTDNSVYEMLLWIPRWENFNKLVIV